MVLRYCVIVTGPAYENQRSVSALQFVRALLKRKHIVSVVFFYGEGVSNSNRLLSVESDETNLVSLWSRIAEKHSIPLRICTSSALRRGISSYQNKKKKNGTDKTVFSKYFHWSSLMHLSRIALRCDRLIKF